MWKLKCAEILSQKIGHDWIKNGFVWQCQAVNFILFVQNFKMMLEASGMLAANAKLRYFYTLLSGEALWKFKTLWVQIRSMSVRLNSGDN